MIFIIEFYLTAVVLCRKQLSLYGNGERGKGGGGGEVAKTCLGLKVACILFNPNDSFWCGSVV